MVPLTLVNALTLRTEKGRDFEIGRRLMTAYRIYLLDAEDHVSGPPQVVECADDQEATHQARRCLVAKPVEIWNEAKLIARLEPDD